MALERRRHRAHEEEPTGEWLTTYSDMVTLLLCFFVMLFAFSTVDVRKFEAFLASFQGSLGIFDGGRSAVGDGHLNGSAAILEEVMGNPGTTRNLVVMYHELQRFIEEEGLTGTVTVTLEEPGVVVRFPDQVLFDLGEADLKPEFEATLRRFAQALTRWDGEIRVEGHADSLPIHRPKFPSNWELSAARASTVVRFFIDRGLDPTKLWVAGFGEYRPIADNTTPEGRVRNRRVDVVLLAHSPNPRAFADVVEQLR